MAFASTVIMHWLLAIEVSSKLGSSDGTQQECSFSNRELHDDVLQDVVRKLADVIIFCNVIVEWPNKYTQILVTILSMRGTNDGFHIVPCAVHGNPGYPELTLA